MGDWVWLQWAERRATPALMEVTQCSLPAAAAGGSSEFPTGNELQLQAESGLRVWASRGPSAGPKGHANRGHLGHAGCWLWCGHTLVSGVAPRITDCSETASCPSSVLSSLLLAW